MHAERVSPAHAARTSSPLQRDILRTLLYFDIFQHPLTSTEIYTYLPFNSTSLEEVTRACASSPLNTLLTTEGQFIRLAESSPASGATRITNERRAQTYMRIARFMTSIIRRFPFVRGVFLSGELSKGIAREESDIDFFIVTAEGRLWICRSLLVLFKKVFLFNRRKFFCINHFVSEQHLEVADRNIYSAIEVATLKPLFNTSLFHRYIQANSWINNFLPNASANALSVELKHDRPSWVQKTIEVLTADRLADWVDRWLMSRWTMIWKERHPELSERQRNRLYQCTPVLSTAYGHDFLARVYDAYNQRLRSYDLPQVHFEGL